MPKVLSLLLKQSIYVYETCGGVRKPGTATLTTVARVETDKDLRDQAYKSHGVIKVGSNDFF